MIILKVDEEVKGYKKELNSSAEVLEELKELLDERVYEVTVKKRAAVNSSQEGSIQINPKEFAQAVQKANCGNV